MEQIITQAEAGRLRKVSRQYIGKLIERGAFTTPVVKGVEMTGQLYLSEVLAFEGEGDRGRPKLTVEERLERGLDQFNIGDNIIWLNKVRSGYGYAICIPAIVIKEAIKRVQLEFYDADNKLQTAWVGKESCFYLTKLASDNE